MVASFIAAALAMVTPGQRAQTPDCRDDRGQDRCESAEQAKQRARYGVEPAEKMAERRTPMMRAFFVDGYGGDAGLVTFLRPPAEEPRVEWRGTTASGAPATTQLSAIVPVTTWDAQEEEGRLFDRPLVPVKTVGVCLHAWVVTVEAVDGRGAVRRRTEGACGDGPVVRYGFRLAAAAAASIPACAVLDPDRTRNDLTRLADCGKLAGDRAAAAQALNTLRSPWVLNPRGADFARPLAHLFFDFAEIAWPGEAPVTGMMPAAEFWATRMAQGGLFIRRVTGETADRVRVDAVFSGRGGSSVPLSMIWTRESGFGFRLRRLGPA